MLMFSSRCSKNHRATADYVRALREQLPREFPGMSFYFLPADIVTQILNFGLPAPIDIQIEGANVQASHEIAEKILAGLHQVSGLTDFHIQQPFDYPTLEIDVDRTKAAQAGYTERDVASSVLNSLSGSFQITPIFFVNWNNGVNYSLVAQTPQYRLQTVKDLRTFLSRAAKPIRKFWRTWLRCSGPVKWLSFPITTSVGWSIFMGRFRIAISER